MEIQTDIIQQMFVVIRCIISILNAIALLYLTQYNLRIYFIGHIKHHNYTKFTFREFHIEGNIK